MLNEIFDDVAKKHKLPIEQVKLIYKSCFIGIRYYLSNPLVSKTILRLPGLGSWKMTDRSVKNYHRTDLVENLKEYKKQFKRSKQ